MQAKIPPPTIETVPVEKLKPWDRNPRKNHAVDKIARSIEVCGYLNPIIVQAGTYRILAGHGRLEALKRKGVTEIPVVVAAIDDDQADLYTIADNRLAELADWDEQVLAQLVKDLEAKGADLDLAGFDPASIERLLAGAEDLVRPGEDEVVEPCEEAVTRPGDMWELGLHRIVCGDSRHQASYLPLFDVKNNPNFSSRASLVFTDPPYGVDYKAKKFDLIKNDELKGEQLVGFLDRVFWNMADVAYDSAAFYIWHASSTREEFLEAMKRAAIVERQYLIWAKPSIVLGHADYHWQHEPCFYAAKEGERPPFYGNRAQATVWEVGAAAGGLFRYKLGQGVTLSAGEREIHIAPGAPRGRKLRRIRLQPGQTAELAMEYSNGDTWTVARDTMAEHPTQKPVELARRAIANSSLPGQIVLDPFLGSGTTLIGCQVTGRVCRAIELTPQYVDVAVRRWQRLTGERAENRTRPGVKID